MYVLSGAVHDDSLMWKLDTILWFCKVSQYLDTSTNFGLQRAYFANAARSKLIKMRSYTSHVMKSQRKKKVLKILK